MSKENVKGLEKLISNLKKLGDEANRKVGQVVKANAEDLEATAKSLAPVDLGKLRQSIKSFKDGELTYKVMANATGNAPYAAFMEFGTGGKVEVPSELKEIASQFRGKGERKVDIKPQPYMYPALVKQRRIFIEDIEQLLIKETKKI